MSKWDCSFFLFCEASGENILCKVLWDLQIHHEMYKQIAIYKYKKNAGKSELSTELL